MISPNAVQPARVALMKAMLCLWLGLSLSVGMNAQGWELSGIGGDNEDQAQTVIQTADQGFLLAGYSESFGVGGNQELDFYLVRTDVDGKILWERVYDGGFNVNDYAFAALETEGKDLLIVGESLRPSGRVISLLRINKYGDQEVVRHYQANVGELFVRGYNITPAADGDGYVLIGTVRKESGDDDILLIRVDEAGEELWRETYGSPDFDEEGTAVTTFQDGYAFTGFTDNLNGNPIGKDLLIYRVDAQGEVIWDRYYGEGNLEQGRDIIATVDGQLAVAGTLTLNGSLNINAFLFKYGENGDLIWNTVIDRGAGDNAHSLVQREDGHFFVTGNTEDPENLDLDILLAEVDNDGNLLWSRSLGDVAGNTAEDIILTAGGGLAITGYDAQGGGTFINDVILIKTDFGGNVQTNYIEGRVFNDETGNNFCAYDQFDEPLEEWIVTAEGDYNTYFGSTDANGYYSILVDTGSYEVSVFPVNSYWSVCPDVDNTVTIDAFYDTVSVDFPIQIETMCPYMEVDVSTPFLTICSDVEYTVSYCNLGTAAAIGAEVRVTLDEELTFLSADLPFEQDGNVYTFQLGNVASTACGSFRIQTEMACDGIAGGQAGLVTAEIFPDTLCVEPDPNWDGASVIVSGECRPDSSFVRFEIRNAGQGEMEEPKLYFIVEDEILLLQDTFKLDPDDEPKPVTLPITGATYRIIAQQSDFHPGMSWPTLAIEGCTNDGEYTTGQFIKFPENDRDPTIAIDVQEAVGSPNSPIELRGYPKGYGEESFIDDSTDITYIIFFSNTGTDTIDRVTIRDTLPAGLDLRTLELGTSSHPYAFRAYGGGILKFTFSDIQLLPGSSADETGSYGYVKFKLSQKLDNPEGTVIRNSAAIYFENEVPRQSNVVRYTVGSFPDFVDSTTVSSQEVFLPGVEIKIAPNPFIESTMFEIEGVTLERVDFQLYDTAGRLVRKENFRGNKFEFQRGGLNSGLYFYSLWSQGQLINTGKVLVR